MPTTHQRDGSYYADTPRGLVTMAGTRFATTEEQLRTWAAPVLDAVPLEKLLQQADTWLRSPRTVAAWALLVMLFALSPAWAATGAVLLFLGWSVLCPAYVSGPVANVLRWIENAFVQGLAYVAMLSMLAAQGHLAAVAVGLAGFVLLRWRLVKLLLSRPVRWVRSAFYPLPAPDQVLRALIVRTALQRRLSLPELDRMERSIIDSHTGNED